MPIDADIPALITEICRAILPVDTPLTLTINRGRASLLIEIAVPKPMRGLLIGRQGQTVVAMRDLATTAAQRRYRVIIEVLDEEWFYRSTASGGDSWT
jgi:predicted RNA-binding protein YlqC (UPF0109 family)